MGILTGRVVCLAREPAEWSSFRRQQTMANDDKPQRSRPKASAPSRPKMRAGEPSERPFDLWLQKQLHAMYDEIANEPLPEDLLDLIDHDAKQKPGNEPSGKK